MSLQARFNLVREGFSLALDLRLPGQGISVLFGPSGSGKTTLLRLLAGLEKDPQGRVQVGSRIWQGGGVFLPSHKRGVGYVFQEPGLFEHLSVQGNIEYALKRVPVAKRVFTLEKLTDLLDLSALLPRSARQLSGGEQQRVAIARALATSPDLLLMDEPLAALDGGRKASLLSCLKILHQRLQIPVLYVTHDREEVAALADYLVLLENGRVIEQGQAAELLPFLGMGIGNMMSASVMAHDERHGVTELVFSGGRLWLERSPGYRPGTEVKLSVAAQDILIMRNKPETISALNVLPVVVQAVENSNTDDTALTNVVVQAGSEYLHIQASTLSLAALKLAPGQQVYALLSRLTLEAD